MNARKAGLATLFVALACGGRAADRHGAPPVEGSPPASAGGAVAEERVEPDTGAADAEPREGPSVLSRLSLGACAHSIQVVGGLAYVAVAGDPGQNRGLWIVDVENPEEPAIVGSWSSAPDDVLDVLVVGRVAYVARGRNGLEAVDVGDPRRPARIGRVRGVEGPVGAIAARDRVLFAANGCPPLTPCETSRLFVLDLADPTAPARVAALDLPAPASDLAVAGERLYLALGHEDGGSGSLVVVDVSTRTAPRRVGQADLPQTGRGVDAIGDRVFVVTAEEEMGPGGFHVVDASHPRQPRLVHSFYEDGLLAVRVVEGGARALVSRFDFGLLVLDVSRPGALSLLWPREPNDVVAGEGALQGRGLFVRGDLAYLVGNGGLTILHVP